MWFDQARGFSANPQIDDPLFREFIAKGYCHLPGAIDSQAIDRYRESALAHLADRDPRLVAVYPMQMTTVPATEADFTRSSVRLVDTYTAIEAAHELLFAPAITDVLQRLFLRPCVCFQSLHFFVGSEQAVHQDTAYVVVKDDPLAFVGIWIALEDVTEGSGELCYYEGSHLIPPFHYAPGRLHFNHEIDSQATHAEHLEYLHKRSQAGGMPLRRFTPKKGDILVWHSLLAHGGSPRTTSASRMSLVGHYMPTGMTPHYFGFLPQERQKYFKSRNGRGWFCSFNSPHEI